MGICFVRKMKKIYFKVLIGVGMCFAVSVSGAEAATPIAGEKTETENTVTSSETEMNQETIYLGNCDLADFALWQEGFYRHLTAEYCDNESYLCLKEYKKVTEGECFTVTVPEEYYFTIREMDANQEFLRTILKYDGVYEPRQNTEYVAVFISRKDGGKTSYAAYADLFETDTIRLLKTTEETGNAVSVTVNYKGAIRAKVLAVSMVLLVVAMVLVYVLIKSGRKKTVSQ